jgi:hypothetical protein
MNKNAQLIKMKWFDVSQSFFAMSSSSSSSPSSFSPFCFYRLIIVGNGSL